MLFYALEIMTDQPTDRWAQGEVSLPLRCPAHFDVPFLKYPRRNLNARVRKLMTQAEAPVSSHSASAAGSAQTSPASRSAETKNGMLYFV